MFSPIAFSQGLAGFVSAVICPQVVFNIYTRRRTCVEIDKYANRNSNSLLSFSLLGTYAFFSIPVRSLPRKQIDDHPVFFLSMYVTFFHYRIFDKLLMSDPSDALYKMIENTGWNESMRRTCI